MESSAYQVHGATRRGRWLITCDHATNHVPCWVNGGDLGLEAREMSRHIAYDPGALVVARYLSRALDGPLVQSQFSRLVIDPNRGEDDPTLIMKLYDGTVIPANRHVDQMQKAERIARLYRPYHAAIAELAPDRVICAVHSFTPQLRGRPPRPWQVAVLSDPRDRRLADPLLAALRAQELCVGDNEPYSGHLRGDSLDRHGLQQNRPSVLIELRQDLITTPQAQKSWAALLAPCLTQALHNSGV